MKKREPSCTAGEKADWCSHCGTQYGVTSKIKNGTAFKSAIPLLGIYPKKPKTLIQKNTGSGTNNAPFYYKIISMQLCNITISYSSTPCDIVSEMFQLKL